MNIRSRLSPCKAILFNCVIRFLLLVAGDALAAGPVQVDHTVFSASTQVVNFVSLPNNTIVTNQLASLTTSGLSFASIAQSCGAQGGIKVTQAYAPHSRIPLSGANFDPYDGCPAVPITLTLPSPVVRVGFRLGADSGAPGVVFTLVSGETVTATAPEFCCFTGRRFVGIEDRDGISSITVTAPSTNPTHLSEHLIFDEIWIDQDALPLQNTGMAPSLSALDSLPMEVYQGREVVAREVLVRFHDMDEEKLTALARTRNLEASRPVGDGSIYLLRAATGNVQQLIDKFQSDSNVLFVEPNFISRLDPGERTISPAPALSQIMTNTTNEPNDTYFMGQWGLKNTGQCIPNGGCGTTDADIEAERAWAISVGSPSTVIGIIDSGVDYQHSDLMRNMWRAPRPFTVNIAGQNIICPAGSHGFNFVSRTCAPLDNLIAPDGKDDSHGTWIAGIIGAVGNNGMGVVGVNWETSMMSLKTHDSSGRTTNADIVDAIHFAVQMKLIFGPEANVRVMNASWHKPQSHMVETAIGYAGAHDILFVTAAGNSRPGNDNDQIPVYPASYLAPNIMSVAATTKRDELWDNSNFGFTSVDLGAPGQDILATTRSGKYEAFSGTSGAAAFVAGAAALVLSKCPLTTHQLKQVLLENTDYVPSLDGRTVTSGRLNVFRALSSCATAAPTLISVTPNNSPAGTSQNVVLVGTVFDSITTTIQSPGITAKNVIIVNPQTINATLDIPLNSKVGPHSITVSTSEGISNAIDFTVTQSVQSLATCRTLITKLYQEYYGRAPEESAIQAFISYSPQCSESWIREQIQNGPEYRRIIITRLYREYYDRDPDKSGMDSFFNSGMSEAAMRQALESSRECLLSRAGACARIHDTCRSRVRRYYLELYSREPDDDGLAAFMNSPCTEVYILDAILNGGEYRRLVITRLYREYYGRDPDPSGMNSFFTSPMSEAQMRDALANSTECHQGNGGLCQVLYGEPPPAPPRALKGFTSRPGTVILAWENTPTNSTYIVVMELIHKTQTILGPTVTTVTLENLTPAESHHFNVIACHSKHCSAGAGVVGVTPNGADAAHLLAAPSSLIIASPRPGTVVLSWRDNSLLEDKFNILVSGNVVASVMANVTTATITDLDPNASYHFNVVACDAMNHCSSGAGVVGKTPNGY